MKAKKNKTTVTNTNFTNFRKSLVALIPRILIFFLILSLALTYFVKPDSSEIAALYHQLAVSPLDSSSHLALAKFYYQNSEYEKAKTELALAKSPIYDTNQILGISTDISSLDNELSQRPIEMAKKREFWDNIAAQYPNYPDAWIYLFLLAIEDGDTTKAKDYLNRMLELDPLLHEDFKGKLSF